MPRWLLRHFVAAVAAFALAGYLTIQTQHLAGPPLRADAYSYYVYLPSVFLYGDPSLDAVARDCCGGAFPEFTAIKRWPSTGRWIDPHPIGVAVLMAPFFLAAHGLTRWSNLPPDGFSVYYQHAAALAGVVAFLGGLALLRRILSRRFSDGVTLAALVTVTFGTNLFHYGVYESTSSHAFSFFLVALLLFLTERWWEAPARGRAVALGVVAGLIALTRHPNVLFLTLIPLYGATGPASVRTSAERLWRRRGDVAIMAAVALVVFAPQLALYKYATGRWFVSSYGQIGGFDFAAPHLQGVLFSVQKGVFLWSPALLLAVAGAFVSTDWSRGVRLAAGLIFVLQTYLIASWWDWQFGGTFGHRGFTDALPFAAVFFAAFYQWATRRPRVSAVVGVVAGIFVCLSIAQMVQHWLGIIPISDTTWDDYRRVFLRFR